MKRQKRPGARRTQNGPSSASPRHGRIFLKEWDAQGVFEGGPPPPDRSSLKPWRKSISRFIDWSVGAQKNLAPLLNQSPVPQLWIAGERDPKFTALARRAAGEQAVIIPRAGHRLPLEAPARLAESLQQFILQNP